MERLSQEYIVQVHRYLLNLYAAQNVEALHRNIPQGLADLIRCDRAALNMMIFGAERIIVPTPVPAYWQKFGNIMVKHLHEHRMFEPLRIPRVNSIESFGDRRNDPSWLKSTLYHEYYLAIGVRYQIGVYLFQTGAERYLLNCNRWTRDFSQKDRLTMELVSPHITRAWQTTCELVRLRGTGEPSLASASRHQTLIVTRRASITSYMAPELASLLTRYFGYPHFEAHKLPGELCRWLRTQLSHIASVDVMGAPPKPLRRQTDEGTLTVTLACLGEDSATLIFSEQPFTPRKDIPASAQLTQREREVLHWIREGKRNREIATILGLSPRTVGKHLENVFSKLGVETRTAAARAEVPSS